MEIKKIRDLSLIKIDNDKTMVIACDSCGSIGMKKGDILKVSPVYVGKFTARVAVLEVICSGAEIITIADAICNEMKPTGEEVIDGIKEELNKAKIDDIVLTGSTEENFITSSTGVGIIAAGICRNKDLKVNNVKRDAEILSIGHPLVGDEVITAQSDEIVSYETIYKLLNNNFIYEIVPVGSKGIAYEASQLSENNNMQIQFKNTAGIDLKKSGGPATSVIAAANPVHVDEILRTIPDVNVIGSLKLK